ncbi:hypothetical protein OH77DRAFT_1426390 [Trametes cingulata]|nr:hypothetical protein OH77DRAFT_1426390 [Trametes cingulata]
MPYQLQVSGESGTLKQSIFYGLSKSMRGSPCFAALFHTLHCLPDGSFLRILTDVFAFARLTPALTHGGVHTGPPSNKWGHTNG